MGTTVTGTTRTPLLTVLTRNVRKTIVMVVYLGIFARHWTASAGGKFADTFFRESNMLVVAFYV